MLYYSTLVFFKGVLKLVVARGCIQFRNLKNKVIMCSAILFNTFTEYLAILPLHFVFCLKKVELWDLLQLNLLQCFVRKNIKYYEIKINVVRSETRIFTSNGGLMKDIDFCKASWICAEESLYLNSWSTECWALSHFLWFDIFAESLLRTKQPQQGLPVQRHKIMWPVSSLQWTN